MKMLKTLTDKRGQTLVIIALAMVAVVAMAAVALDGGHAFMQRRRMQNAADAGALAGARELASGGSDCQAVAGDYAVTRNGADQADIDCGVSVSNEVVVTTTKTFSTWFGGVIGLNEIQVRARAVAGIYRGEGCVTAPIALFVGKIPEWPDPPTGTTCLIIFDTDKEIGDVEEGYVEIAGANRGWLGLDCNPPNKCSPDAAQLKEWVLYGPTFTVTVPGLYMGDTGSKTSVVAEVREDWDYVIPVYNRVWEYTSQKRCQKSWDNNDICMIGAPGDAYDESYTDLTGTVHITDTSYCDDDPVVPNVPDGPEVYPPEHPSRCEEDCCCTPEAAGIIMDPDDPNFDDKYPTGKLHPSYCPDSDPLEVDEYTTDASLSGAHYYNIVELVCFHVDVDGVNTSGPVKWIKGCVADTCSARCLAGEPWVSGDTGPLVVKLID